MKYVPSLGSVVAGYTSKISADWSLTSRYKLNEGKAAEGRRGLQQERLGDDVPMHKLADRHFDHRRPVSEPISLTFTEFSHPHPTRSPSNGIGDRDQGDGCKPDV